jgi:16S rRNA (guanine527-N7)-methyltransferase
VTEEEDLTALLVEGGVEPRFIPRLSRFGALLLERNRRLNLTGASSPAQVLPHLLDSLSLVPYVRDPLVDVGSGGGFPAIPLAIATGAHVVLVEAAAKKGAFLREACAEVQVPAEVIVGRAEDAGRDPAYRERFMSGTARGVAAAPAVIELVMPFLGIGGLAILQRGAIDERERHAAADAAPMLGGRLEAEIPLGGERRLLLIRKTSATPQRFPRRAGLPQKRPLCLR